MIIVLFEMGVRRDDVREWIKTYLRQNGPSRIYDIYYALSPYLRQKERHAFHVFAYRLAHSGNDVRYLATSVIGIDGQILDPLKMYPRYTATVLKFALENDGAITLDQSRTLLGRTTNQANGHLGYLRIRGLLERRNGIKSGYFITQKGKEVMGKVDDSIKKP